MNAKKAVVGLHNKTHSLVRHHLDSYNHFIDNDMKAIVQQNGKRIKEKFSIEVNNIVFNKPNHNEDICTKVPITPQHCRMRNITYSGDILASVRFIVQRGPGKPIEFKQDNVLIGRMPVMVRSKSCHLYGMKEDQLINSGECIYDAGGYFIIHGREKVFLMQEQISKNRMILDKKKISKKGGIKLKKNEVIPDRDICCYVVSADLNNTIRNTLHRYSGYFYFTSSLFTEDIPLFVLFAAFNMPAHYDVFKAVGSEKDVHNELECSMMESVQLGIFSQKQALYWLIPRMKTEKCKDYKITANPSSQEDEEMSLYYTRHLLATHVLHHVPGSADNLIGRAKFLGLMTRRIILAEKGKIALDDRDFYGVKRIDLVGQYLFLAFYDKFINFMDHLTRDLSTNLEQKKATPIDPVRLIKTSFITDNMELHLHTGNWDLKRFAMSRTGVTQHLERQSYLSAIGHLARINSQFEKVRKISGARAIHPSQYGYVCPADTPEGADCGLVKTLAFLVDVTLDMSPDLLIKLIKSCSRFGEGISTYFCGQGQSLIMVNGVPIGWTMEPRELVSQLRSIRRREPSLKHVSIYYSSDEDVMHVTCDSGRMVRPYIVLDNNGRSRLTRDIVWGIENSRVSWDFLLQDGIVEYLDAREAYTNCLVAYDDKLITNMHTHLDIDPATILGSIASVIPFPNHNQSPRNTYQCAMGKQALGVIALNQKMRFDGLQHILVYPQRPLTLSHVGELINYSKIPAGCNAIVAITCFGGHDIEDALIVNKASLERGLFRSLTKRSFGDTLKDNDIFGVNENKKSREQAIESDGVPWIGSMINNGDSVINKFVYAEKDPIASYDLAKAQVDPEPVYKPVCYHGADSTYCRSVMRTTDGQGYKLIKVSTTQMRTPEEGDKFSSRHGQKGVIGRVVPQSEMPYTEDGIVPDIIMNPHGFPSRMTVGKLIELLANKASVLDGKFRDSSAFTEAKHLNPDDDFMDTLCKFGFSYSGKDVLYRGTDGGVMDVDIFFGPVFYQRLKHMVQDKIHARSIGKNNVLTRQPTAGRSNDGGLRIGEMERDCLIAYGATQLIKERMMFSSDPFPTYICEGCGMLATSSNWCQMCRSSQRISRVCIPYATKLLFQELMAMQIKVKVELSNVDCVGLMSGGQ